MIGYLLASTPSPRLGERPDITPEAFLERCDGFLSEEQHHDLRASMAFASPAGDSVASPRDAAARGWAEEARQVDRAVARERAARARGAAADASAWHGPVRGDIRQAVAQAFGAPHPGARERALDVLRWGRVDEIGRADPDGFGALIARGVQLQLAARQMTWDVDAGWAALEAALRQIEDDRG